MPTIEEIEEMRIRLFPEIKCVGFETKNNKLLWKFTHTYKAFDCPLQFEVKVESDKRGKILRVSGY